MINPGDRVFWDEQPGKLFEVGPESSDVEPCECPIIPAGRGIVFAAARGESPAGGFGGPEGTPNKRSYIVRSDEYRPYHDRRLIWLADLHPELRER